MHDLRPTSGSPHPQTHSFCISLPQVVKVLLQAGADPNITVNGNPPLKFAGSSRTSSALATSTASYSITFQQRILHAYGTKRASSWTVCYHLFPTPALFLVAERGNLAMVRLLLNTPGVHVDSMDADKVCKGTCCPVVHTTPAGACLGRACLARALSTGTCPAAPHPASCTLLTP